MVRGLRKTSALTIRAAATAEDIALARVLFKEYADHLREAFGKDTSQWNIWEEIETLPGRYAPPRGRILLAFAPPSLKLRRATQPAGCVALRPVSLSPLPPLGGEGKGEGRISSGDGVCEMKRFFIRPASQGKGFGRKLAQALLDEARDMGYTKMVLHSTRQFEAAVGIYRKLGFHETLPYEPGGPDGVYMEKQL